MCVAAGRTGGLAHPKLSMGDRGFASATAAAGEARRACLTTSHRAAAGLMSMRNMCSSSASGDGAAESSATTSPPPRYVTSLGASGGGGYQPRGQGGYYNQNRMRDINMVKTDEWWTDNNGRDVRNWKPNWSNHANPEVAEAEYYSSKVKVNRLPSLCHLLYPPPALILQR